MIRTYLTLGLLAASLCRGQSGAQRTVPERGLRSTGSFTISDVEAIDNVTGTVSLNIPVASLPPGPNGFTHGVNLIYHSSVYDIDSTQQKLIGNPGTKKTVNALVPKPDDVWGWGYRYGFFLERRFPDVNNYPGGACANQEYKFNYKLWIVLPDGSRHATRLLPQVDVGGDANNDVLGTDNNGDGFFLYDPKGFAPCAAAFTGTMSYHTVDSTFLRFEYRRPQSLTGCDGTNLAANFDGTQQLRWTVHFPDGKRAGGCSDVLGPNVVIGADALIDRHGNWIKFKKTDTSQTITHEIWNPFNNKITIEQTVASAQDKVRWTGANGEALEATIQRGNTTVANLNYEYTADGDEAFLCDPNNSACVGSNYGLGLPALNVPNVQWINLPGGDSTKVRRFEFGYGPGPGYALSCLSACWGELRQLKYVTGTAQANGTLSSPIVHYAVRYSYQLDAISRTAYLNPVDNPVATKTFCHGGDCSTGTEVTTYTFTDTSSTVKAPDTGETLRTFANRRMASNWMRGLVTKTTFPNGNTEESVWSRNVPANTASTDPGNTYVSRSGSSATSGGIKLCAATTTKVDKNGNQRTIMEYGWTSVAANVECTAASLGTNVRKTVTTYSSATPDAGDAPTDGEAFAYWKIGNAARYLIAPGSKQVLAANDAKIAETTYTYPSLAVAQATGNPSSVNQWDNGPAIPRYASTSFQYATNGNVTQSVTPGLIATDTGYDSNGRYAISKTIGGQRRFRYCHDLSTGLIRQELDLDNLTGTEYAYDRLGRPLHEKQVTFSAAQLPADNTNACVASPTVVRQTSLSYDDSNRAVTRRQDLATAADGVLIDSTTFDSHFRPTVIQTPGESGSTVQSLVKYKYDGTSFVEASSNPQGSTADATAGWTLVTRDQMGRVTSTKWFEGSQEPPPFNPSSTSVMTGQMTTSYGVEATAEATGTTTTVTEAGITRKMVSDGLGRVIQVVEANDAAKRTEYTYDQLDNLTEVKHVGTPNPQTPQVPAVCGPGADLIRKFSYTSLKQVKTVCNPESRTITYTYNVNGDILTKTDGRGVVTCHGTYSGSGCDSSGYDALGRLVKKTYSDSTPHVALSYDAAGYGKGKLSKVETKSLASLGGFVRTAVSYDSYDALGRILGHTQSVAVSTPPDAAGPIPSVQPAMRTYLFEYRYNLAGMTYMKYPSGRVVEYEVDQTSGRQTAVKATSGTPTYYAKQISYWPSGAMKQLRYETKVATGAPPEIWEERCYNGRNQMTTLRIRDLQSPGCARAASDQFFQGYGYGPAPLNNGNVRGGTIWRGANLWSQTYAYDSRNRLLSVNETAGTAANPPLSYKQTFAYDAVGNRAMDSTASPADYFPDGATYAPYAAPADIPAIFPNNQWTGAKYDNSGNLTEILTTTRAYAYDGESRMVKASGPKIAGYEYDGLGRRIRKNVEGSGEHWIYVYAADGSLAAEYPEVGGLPLTGRRYVVGDMLGSTRLTMKEDGSQDECMDYTPFGSELPQSLRTGLTCYPVEPEVKKAAPTGVTEKFTGKERDAETGLDYFGARYMSAAQGRFTSPDLPLIAQRPSDPQSWNLYSYTRNNPLSYVDPDGRQDRPPHAECNGNQECIDGANHATREVAEGVVNGIAVGLQFIACPLCGPEEVPFPAESSVDRAFNFLGELVGGAVLGAAVSAAGELLVSSPVSSSKSPSLWHWTTEQGAAGINSSGSIVPSAAGPTTGRYGSGVYLTDIGPGQIGAVRNSQLTAPQRASGMISRSEAAEAIFGSGRQQYRMQVALEVNTGGLPVSSHRPNVFSTPGPVPLERILSQARPTLFPARK